MYVTSCHYQKQSINFIDKFIIFIIHRINSRSLKSKYLTRYKFRVLMSQFTHTNRTFKNNNIIFNF